MSAPQQDPQQDPQHGSQRVPQHGSQLESQDGEGVVVPDAQDWCGLSHLLAAYADCADRHDAAGAAAVLAGARVDFDGELVEGRDRIEAFYAGRWDGAPAQRHDLTNVVAAAQPDGSVRCSARFARWQLEPAPAVVTLGTYDVTADLTRGAERLTSFVVRRLWTAAPPTSGRP